MAIYLITGTPGSGKTLNTIKDVWKRSQDEQRLVYYFGIPLNFNNDSGVDFSLWREMGDPAISDLSTDVTPYSWFNAPEGSILLIDECQNYYPSSGSSAVSKAPDYIKKFSTHRHSGFDIYLITQAPALLHSSIKDFVQPHIHYRRIWGGNSTWKYVNEHCVNSIRDIRSIAAMAIKSKVKLDKSWFSVYNSAVLHSSNRRMPKKLILLIIFAVVFLLSSFFVLRSYYISQVSSTSNSSNSDNNFSSSVQSSQHKLDKPSLVDNSYIDRNEVYNLYKGSDRKFNPVEDYIPRVSAMPETAPAYDDLRKPRDFPRPQCLMMGKICKCYTQQATLMVDYPTNLCVHYVNNGYFDPTLKGKRSIDNVKLNASNGGDV